MTKRRRGKSDGRKRNSSRPYNNHEIGTSIFTCDRKEDKKAIKTNK
jgi:hypothetical protein